MKKYEQHPIGAKWPPLPESDFNELVESIDAHGVLDKITVFEGKILDGWHRYQACQKLNIKNIPMLEYEGDDPFGFVFSKNKIRRHSSASVIAIVVAESIDFYEKSGRPSQYMERIKCGKITTLSAEEAAKMAGVSKKTMHQAIAATKAEPEVKDAVKDGEMSVSEAAKLSKLDPEKQREAVEKKKSAPKREKPKAEPKEDSVPLSEYQKLREEYDELSSNYQALAAELDACEAIRNGEQMDHFKKLNQQIISLSASRDEFQNKCGELTRQVNYLNAKLKKTKE